MAIGTLGALAISTGASLAGKLANSAFNERPEIPDYTSEVEGKFANARRNLEDKQERQTDQVQADAAAAGVNPISAMADVIESNNQAQADLGGNRADALARAENKEKRAEFGQEQRQYQSTAQGIGSMVSAVSQGASNVAALNALEEMQNKPGGGGGGGGDGGGSGGGAAGAAGGGSAGGASTSAFQGTVDPGMTGAQILANNNNPSGGGGGGFGGISFLKDLQMGMSDQTNPLLTQLGMDQMDGMGLQPMTTGA